MSSEDPDRGTASVGYGRVIAGYSERRCGGNVEEELRDAWGGVLKDPCRQRWLANWVEY